MKIALIADTFLPMRTSGAVQLRDLARELSSNGHELIVFVPDSTINQKIMLEEIEGYKLIRVRTFKIKDVSHVRRLFAELLMPHIMWFRLRSNLNVRTDWDCILWYSPSIFHTPLVRRLKLKSGGKRYLILRDIFPDWALDVGILKKGPFYYFLKFIARMQYDAADIIGVQSPGNLRYFKTWELRRSTRSIEVLNNWLGTHAKSTCSVRIEETILAGRVVFVHAGNMGIAQDLETFLKLAYRMKVRTDIGFLFIGRGQYSYNLQKEIERLGLDNTLLLDEIDPDEISELYSQCHVGIVSLNPDHKSHNIPGKFLSYMQSGLPVLAKVNPGNDLCDLIRREKVGSVVESASIDELHAKCIQLIEHLTTDAELSDRCIKVFERDYSVGRAAKQLCASVYLDDQ